MSNLLNKKRIIWLDDHFESEFYEDLLDDIASDIKSICHLEECCDLLQFHEELDSTKNCHGIIIDVMVAQHLETPNFEKLDESGIIYRSSIAGIQIIEILKGIVAEDGRINQYKVKFGNTPIMLLTGEFEDPKKHHKDLHPALYEFSIHEPNGLRIHSKGESNINNEIKNWINELSDV